LHLGLEVYAEDRIHGTRVPVEELRSLTDRLLAMTSSERAALGPMQPGREDVIHGGAIVLLGALDRYGFDEVVVSEADNLDGSVATID
jgi:exopolyphosphatase / guanosine-5'-triphosphate,3'-diphosphate pyrophosphatase